MTRTRGRAGLVCFRALPMTVLLFLLVPRDILALADDTAIGRAADGVYPVVSTDVEMVAEDVVIALVPLGEGKPPLRSDVTCEFVFRNTSSNALEVEMAFPGEVAPDPELGDMGGASGGDNASIQDFSAAVDGQALAVKLEPASRAAPEIISGEAASAFSSWYTFTVPFGAGETRTVTNSYWVMNTHDSIGTAWASYVLETGRYWKGPIGKATVAIELGDIGLELLENLFPNTWRVSQDGRRLVWTRERFEPAFDLIVRYNVRPWEGRGDPSALSRKLEHEKWLTEGPTAVVRELMDGYAAAVAEGDSILATIIRSFLPEESLPNRPPTISSIGLGRPPGAGPETCPVLRVAFADPDGDIISLGLRASREEQGRTVEVYNLVDIDRWVYRSEYSGAYEAFLGDAEAYQIEVTLTDSLGHTAVEHLDWRADPAGTPGAGRTFPWVLAGALAVAATILLVLFSRRAARRPV